VPSVKRRPSEAKTAGRSNPARAAQVKAAVSAVPEPWGRTRLLALCLLSFLLSLPLFAPWSFWPFGYVVFVPWLIALGTATSARWAYFDSYLLGAAFFLFHFRWLIETTLEGYVAASLLYLALAFPLAAWPIRHLYRTWRIRLTIAFPVVWTAVEIARTYNPLGFPWFFLGHSQIRALPMVQIADLAGVYGVTFVVAAVNGLFADLALRYVRVFKSPVPVDGTPGTPTESARRPRPGMATCVALTGVLLVATFGYGQYRLSQETMSDGPVVAVLQGDFLLKADINDPGAASDEVKEQTYLDLMSQALAERPDVDLVVLPETPWFMYLNREFREHRPRMAFWHKRWTAITQETGKSVLVGAMSEEPQPKGTYPPQHRYNSAFLYTPGEPEPQRYDKVHLVPFGEYVPFRYSRYFHFIYRFFAFGPWNPWGKDGYEYSLTPGREFTVMNLPQSTSGQNGRFGVTICYEDVIPRIFRKFVYDHRDGKRLDFMLNISNDGWFGHGTQQAQHLVNCAFRAIENRVGVARAVNTGISGFIDPDGRWRDLVQDPGRPLHAGKAGYSVARMRLDSRTALYSRWGDSFGAVCAALTLAAMADGIRRSVQNRRARRKSAASKPG